MNPCEHKVQYYETDGMGIVHHSNYIRWFEEARVDLLEQLGFGYDRIEEAGYSGAGGLLPVQNHVEIRRNRANRSIYHAVQRRTHDAAL